MGLADPIPDWVSHLRLAEQWSTRPWILYADIFGEGGPSPLWWVHKNGILAEADARVAKKRSDEANAPRDHR